MDPEETYRLVPSLLSDFRQWVMALSLMLIINENGELSRDNIKLAQ